MNAVVIINKEKGYTSHDVVAIVKKITGLKTGHTGTLDPNAEGVLPLCLGRATKLSGLLTAETKEYVAEVVLGTVTDTCDTTGTVLEQKKVNFDEEIIKETVLTFTGKQNQQPPMYSAIKIDGKKLYELAREGKTVEREAREIFIESINIETFSPEKNTFTMRVECSKGTYIRSLCADIGAALGCGACMGALTRTRSGRFTLQDAVKLDVFMENPADFFLPVEEALPYPKAYVEPEIERMALNGNPLTDSMLAFTISRQKMYWVFCGERLIGLYKWKKRRFKAEAMMV